MKMHNWYTTSLVILAAIALFYSLSEIDSYFNNIFIVLTIIVIILEIFPIKVPSGDQYAAGSIGYLFLLIHEGFSFTVMAIFIATLAYYVRSLRRGKIPIIRLFVTIGMYIVSAFSSLIVWKLTSSWNMFIMVALVALVFELVNIVLLEGIQATVFQKKMFTNIRQQLKELTLPVIICIIVIPRLMLCQTETDLIVSLLYTLFFLLIVIFFSYEFSKQFSLRQANSKAFIQILEGSIAPSLAGHGNRVGVICETILEGINYPKRKRNDLVQIAVIHDIGKSFISSNIFRKRGNLTLSEELEYKSHPEKAVDIVKTMYPNESFSNWILHHHERWDGKGFPRGIQGEEIPLESRIIALANELDYILTRQEDPETVLKLLKERAGTILDPKLVAKVEKCHIENILYDISYDEVVKERQELMEEQYSTQESYTSIGDSFFIQMKEGQALTANHPLPNRLLQELTNTALERQEPVHETFIHEQRTLDLHAQTLHNGEVTIFAHDLTPYLGFRKQLEQNILESYVEVINTLSEGKVKLHASKSSLVDQLGEKIAEMAINGNADVPKSRVLAVDILKQYPTVFNLMQIQIAVSEAATNIVKHATGGNLSIYLHEERIQFFISDKGSGIPLHEIPKTILVSGYSSKKSLGQGFKMMATLSDGVQVHTSSEGTYILIDYKRKEITS
ncbi:HD domain-containing phosphohydrolase [Neobacillus sp. K501]